MSASLFKHKPVLWEEILTHFPPLLQSVQNKQQTKETATSAPIQKKQKESHEDKPPASASAHSSPNLSVQRKWMLDATFGAGGHTKAVLNRYPFLSVIAIDRDLSAIEWGINNVKPHFPNRSLHLIHADFHKYSNLMQDHFPVFMKGTGFDIIIVDLGVSSPQLDQAHRGFSFYKDGPLDMRMDRTQSFSAGDIVNRWSKKELTDLFYMHGEIHRASRVVTALLKQRKRAPLESTKQLADLIVKVKGWRKKRSHPAAPYFLALRMKVNNELEDLSDNLLKMIQSLNLKGRLFVLTFHSLEDRIVKNLFKTAHKVEGQNLTKKVIVPCREEIKHNPRARSAKLRIFERKKIDHV